jgi:hypothetical protein
MVVRMNIVDRQMIDVRYIDYYPEALVVPEGGATRPIEMKMK